MVLEEIITVSGASGLFKLYSRLPNGLILEDINNHNKKLYPSRKHQFTPLATIGIYTYQDTIPLKDVFHRLFAQESLPDDKTADKDMHSWFRTVLPEYDEYRVRTTDIRKLLKWFIALKSAEIITAENTKEEEQPEEEKK
jgi:hypothetical protein